jgi:hypothetical protein
VAMQRERDRIKLILCAQAGVRVVEIPSVPDITSIRELPKCIARGLESLGIVPPIPPESIAVSLEGVYERSCLDELRRIAEARGGELLSSVYLGVRTKVRWRCAAGHEWDAAPGSVRSGAWCALCYGNVKKSIDEVRNAVAPKGITLLSAEYQGNKSKLKWRCANGHEWMATPQRVMHGTGCPRCAGRNKSIDDMRRLAQRKGGVCLSTAFRNMNAPLEWQCSNGHRFAATPNTVLRQKQQWCPECSVLQRRQERVTRALDRLHSIASDRRGRVVSTDYVDAKTALEYECDRKHTWTASATSVMRGSWCPFCASEKVASRNRAARNGIAQMQALAITRGGKCVSTEYLSCRDKLLWECSKGHRWEATPSNIKNNKRWCPRCSGKMRKTVADMHVLGKSRGFAFRSEEYLGDDKHHLWQCPNGHLWKAKPSNIKQGRGCPDCAKTSRWVRRREHLKPG